MSKLLIVESPAKAKTIGKYLGSDFTVKSSVGHIRDLPKENGAIKVEKTGEESWTFTPTYIVSEGKTKVVNELKAAVKSCDEIYLASDPDREGEAIAWHLKEVLGRTAGAKPFHRVTYNEITKSAVLKAVAEPREIDMPLVDAQQARRILDRLVGYKVSPLLWKNINIANNRSLSAGRVQSVALRLLVERQREIDAFKPKTYYLMGVEAKKDGDAKTFTARFAKYDGEKPDVRDREIANRILLDLAGSKLQVKDLKEQPKTRHALPPFTTSTLQQSASSVLGFSPGKTMKLAQSLYEHGRITYMRSDSVNVSEQARGQAKDFITTKYGAEFYPEKPNFFKSKDAAQEAHEAIRPTNVTLEPQASGLEAQELKLYDLIWRRFVASQMADAKTVVSTILLDAVKPGLAHSYGFSASATRVEFEGFLKVMKMSLKKKTKDGEDDEDTDEVAYLPKVAVGEMLEAVRWISDEKQTKGPTHYSEASLIKALEENGVGRPSTYAATIETLKLREYAKTEKKKLVPLERGTLVCEWLVKKMDDLFSVGYTAQMEAELDKVAEKGEPMNQMLSEFYSKFIKEIDKASDPPPDRSKFEFIFALLGEVKEWKEAKKIGKRVYDDKAFYESCLEQFRAGEKQMSARQLEFLIRMALMYEAQIEQCSDRLASAGLSAGKGQPDKGDPVLAKFCFSVMDRMSNVTLNPFIKSLREQWERGRPLSPKQLQVLAKAIGERAVTLPDCQEIREKLSQVVTNGFGPEPENQDIARLLELFKYVKAWRPVTRIGKFVYDDEKFISSIIEQFNARKKLSSRQMVAVKRVVRAYKTDIPDYEKVAEEFGLEKVGKNDDKA